MSPTHLKKLVFLHINLRLLKKIKERGSNANEITIDMVDKENDEERLLVLQSQQEVQVDENESFANVMAYLDDNAQDDDDDDDFEDDDISLNED